MKVLPETREERDQYKMERDTLKARLESMATADEDLDKLRNALVEANEMAKVVEEVPELKRGIEELGYQEPRLEKPDCRA